MVDPRESSAWGMHTLGAWARCAVLAGHGCGLASADAETAHAPMTPVPAG